MSNGGNSGYGPSMMSGAQAWHNAERIMQSRGLHIVRTISVEPFKRLCKVACRFSGVDKGWRSVWFDRASGKYHVEHAEPAQG